MAACVFTINIYKYVISLSAKITNKTLEYYKNNMLNWNNEKKVKYAEGQIL